MGSFVAKCSSKDGCLAPVAKYISAGAYAPVLPTLPLPLIKWYYIIDTRKYKWCKFFDQIFVILFEICTA